MQQINLSAEKTGAGWEEEEVEEEEKKEEGEGEEESGILLLKGQLRAVTQVLV